MKKLLILLSLLIFASVAICQTPSDIEKLASEGDYFHAMVKFEALPRKKQTTDALIAAGRSAWALSLPKLAIERLEAALAKADLDGSVVAPSERARVMLYRGIIEYQEDRFQTAVAYAERAIQSLDEPSTLRAKALLLQGEALEQQSMFANAEKKLVQAMAEGSQQDLPNIAFALARTQRKLGKNDDAIEVLKSVPIDHERAHEALRLIADILFSQGKDSDGAFWLAKGKELFPDSFVDSWVSYGLLRGAIANKNTDQVIEISKNAASRYAPSDYWFTLLDALAESYLWTGAQS